MKKEKYILILLVIVSLLGSCKKDDAEIESEKYFKISTKAWLNFKEASNNNYRYVVEFSSWVGYKGETTLTINNGKVVKRSFVGRMMDRKTFKYEVVEEWTEEKESLNSHQNGANVWTLDDVYHKAKTEWLLKREAAFIYFETKNNGMISTSGYSEKNCADDCFTGIYITSIEKL